jgi:hypothetical protein
VALSSAFLHQALLLDLYIQTYQELTTFEVYSLTTVAAPLYCERWFTVTTLSGNREFSHGLASYFPLMVIFAVALPSAGRRDFGISGGVL